MERIYYNRIETPLGDTYFAASEKGLVQFNLSGNKASFFREIERRIKADVIEDTSRLKDTKVQLDRYFKGEKFTFSAPLDMRGTKFQVDVLKEIHTIPNGRLTSYSRLAKQIGRLKAVRAVGNVVDDNPRARDSMEDRN